jgi:hypothetical protein
MPNKITETEARKIALSFNFTPQEPYTNLTTPWKVKCNKCKKVHLKRLRKIKLGQKCPYCVGNRVDESDLIKLMKNAGVVPMLKYPGRNDLPWKSKCITCKKVVFPRYSDISQGQGGCKYCGNKVRGEKKRLTKDQVTSVAINAGFLPLVEYQNANTPWKCRCVKCNKISLITFSSISRGSGCKFCANNAPVSETEMLREFNKAGFKILEPLKKANSKIRLECTKCFRESTVSYSSIKRNQSICKYCANRAPLDEETTRSFYLSNNLKPLEPYKNARTSWKSLCLICNYVVSPTYTNVKRGSGCKYCAKTGFDFDSSAIIYLITNEILGAHKIGVAGTSEKNERMSKHSSQKWKVFKIMEFDRGENAFIVEQEILRWLRKDKDLMVYLSGEQMPQGGFTETVDASEIDLPTIWAKVEEFSRINL